jgi:DNA polymerase-3 subunit gamma/tau
MEYTALYRRFRPLTFDGIVGQEHITRTLKNQVIANRVGHAYLFTGCRGCGKTSSAKVLARAVNCLHPKDGEPCNECEICKAALDGSLTDIVEMDAASNNGVDDIRAIRDEVNFLPTVAKYRVYIIDEVHMLSPGAFNALLKTLEEPPKHVKFILATTEPQKLPATILSRCQRFDFKKIPEDKIVENLKYVCNESNIKYTEGALNLIAELSEGAMRDALSILERCAQDGENSIEENKIKEIVGIPETKYIMNIAEKVVDCDSAGALEVTQEVIKSGKDVTNLLWEMIKFFRDLMLLKTTKEISNIYSEDDGKEMKSLCEKVQTDRILRIIYSLSELENSLKWSSQKNIVFQVGVIKLCSDRATSLEDRIAHLENYFGNIQNGKISVKLSTEVVQNVKNAGVNVMPSVNNMQGVSANVMPNANNVQGVSVNANLTNDEKNSQGISTKSSNDGQEKDKSKENSEKNNNKGSSNPKENKVEVADFWGKVIDSLKAERQPMLYSNLLNTKGVILDDMTFGIQFPNGLNSFGKSIIEKPENMSELKRLVSIECKKDMRIKLIDNKNAKSAQQPSQNGLAGLGINVNVIN